MSRRKCRSPLDPAKLTGSPLGRVRVRGAAPHHSHQLTRPRWIKKCDRHPSRNHTDGVSVGRPLPSVEMSQRGSASSMTSSSTDLPQPQGHRKPTHQSSPPSRASTRLRRGSLPGKLSPTTNCRRRQGWSLDHSLRHHNGRLIMTPQVAEVLAAKEGRVKALSHRGREWRAWIAGMQYRRRSPLLQLQC